MLGAAAFGPERPETTFPVDDFHATQRFRNGTGEKMVGMGRFELPTSPTRKERSTKLSHIPTLSVLSAADAR